MLLRFVSLETSGARAVRAKAIPGVLAGSTLLFMFFTTTRAGLPMATEYSGNVVEYYAVHSDDRAFPNGYTLHDETSVARSGHSARCAPA